MSLIFVWSQNKWSVWWVQFVAENISSHESKTRVYAWWPENSVLTINSCRTSIWPVLQGNNLILLHSSILRLVDSALLIQNRDCKTLSSLQYQRFRQQEQLKFQHQMISASSAALCVLACCGYSENCEVVHLYGNIYCFGFGFFCLSLSNIYISFFLETTYAVGTLNLCGYIP